MIEHLTFIGLPCLGLDWLVLARLGFDEGVRMPYNLVVTSVTSATTARPPSAGVGALRAPAVVADVTTRLQGSSKPSRAKTSQSKPRQGKPINVKCLIIYVLIKLNLIKFN